ncbi:T9SS type A sorting domain-containing protein [bacterium]|nr:T9SS type A sorting domain-containing protein [bacterium]
MYFSKSSRSLICAFFAISALLLAGSAYADHVYWMNASGGNWNVGANWNTGTVPTSADIAHINLDGTYAVTLNSNPTVLGLELGGYSGTQRLICTSWELTVNGSFDINENGYLDLQSSAVHTSGDYILTNAGTIECELSDIELKVVNQGTMTVWRTCDFARTFLNDTTGTLTLEGTSSGNADMTVDQAFTNRGTIELTSSWPVTTTVAYLRTPNTTFVNEATGNINSLLGSSFNTTSSRYIQAEMQNAGTITAQTTGISIYNADASHTNTGTLYAQGGDLSFTSGGGTASVFENTGTITVDSGMTFGCGTDTVKFTSGSVTVSSDGGMSFPSNDVYVNYKYVNNGRIAMTGAGGNINLADTLFNDGTIYMVNANLVGAAPIINSDSLQLVNSDIDVDCVNSGVCHATINGEFAGQFTSMPGSKVVSEGTASNWCIMAFGNSWTNHGTIELTQSGFNSSYVSLLNLSDTLTNASDGVINAVAGTGTPAATRYVSAQLINNGTINVTGANTYISQGAASHENHGTINLTGGNLTVTDKFSNTGDIAIDTTYQFIFSGTRMTLGGGAISGSGRFDNDNDTLHFTGPVTNSSRMYLGQGTLLMDDTLTSTGLIYLGGTDGSGSGAIKNRGMLNFAGGSSLGFGVVNEGSFVAELTNTIGGTFVNSINDTTTLLGNSTGSSSLTISNGFTNYGAIILTSEQADAVTTATLAVTSGTLTNSSTGSIVSDIGSSTGGERYLQAQVNNQGLIQANDLKLTWEKSGASHSNSGTIELVGAALALTLSGSGSFNNSGTIHLQNMMTMTVDQGTFTNATTGQYTGNGSFNLYATTFANDGFVEPGDSPGRINMQANDFVMDTNAQLKIEIGGLTADTEHDVLYCTQNAGFGGVLDIDLIDSYIPTVGDSFKVCTYNARTSNFLAILGLSQMGVTFDTNFTADGLWLVTESISNTPPVISGMPGTRTFANDTSSWLTIWDYVSDDWTNDTNMTYSFTVTNDSLLYSLNIAGVLVLTAEPGYVGVDTLEVEATDEHGASSVDTCIVTVTASNTDPVIAGLPDSVSYRTDSSYTLDIFAAVTDAETADNMMSYMFIVSGDSVSASWSAITGILTLTATNGFIGSTQLVINVDDTDGGTASDTITVTVTAIPNTPPVISGLIDSVTFRTDSTVTVDIYSAVTDAEEADSLLGYMFAAGHVSLDVTWNGTAGEITIAATDDWSGDSYVAVTVTDAGTAQAFDTIWVTVTAVPTSPPVLTMPDSAGFDANDSLLMDIHSMVVDDSHDTLMFYAFSTSNDSLDYSWDYATGILTLKSADGWSGVAWLRLTITDPDTLLAHDSTQIYVFPSLDVPDDELAIPNQFVLKQNYPNPFNPSTTIEFGLPASANVRIVVYNVLGESVRVLADRVWPAGVHRVSWNGRDENGRVMSSGVYFYRLESAAYSATQKMLLVK